MARNLNHISPGKIKGIGLSSLKLLLQILQIPKGLISGEGTGLIFQWPQEWELTPERGRYREKAQQSVSSGGSGRNRVTFPWKDSQDGPYSVVTGAPSGKRQLHKAQKPAQYLIMCMYTPRL